MLVTHFICSKRVLPVCGKVFIWLICLWCFAGDSIVSIGNRKRSVNICESFIDKWHLNTNFCRVRGFLGSTVVLSANLGILIALILGNYCDFFVPPKVVITLCLLFVILFSFFPESPLFLLKQNRISVSKKK